MEEYKIFIEFETVEDAYDYLERRGYGDYAEIIDDNYLGVRFSPEDIELDDILGILEDGGFNYSVDIEEEVYEDEVIEEEE